MSLAYETTVNARSLPSLLAEVRRRIRAYVALEGLGATLAAGALGFWLALGIDWLFEPPGYVRLVISVLVILATLVVFWRRFMRRVFARLPDQRLALVVERRYRDLNDSLLTTVDLNPAELSEHGRILWAGTRQQAERRLASTNVADLFDVGPRNRAAAAGLLIAASVVGFAFLMPGAFRLGVDRLLALTDVPWPRRTHLEIDGFPNGERVVAVGSDVELIVRADARKVIPHDVYLRYRTDDGIRDEQQFDREGAAQPGRDSYQLYKTSLRGISSSMDLDIRGGDDRLRNLRIRTVERPQARLRLSCVYPEYTGRAKGEIDVTGPVPLPQGTLVAVSAVANKPLREVIISKPDGRGGLQEMKLVLSANGGAVGEFRFDVGRILTDVVLTLKLHDLDGIDNQTFLSLQTLVDNPPTVAVYRRGVEAVVTPQGRLPFSGKVTDDYGTSRLGFQYTLDDGEAKYRPATARIENKREVLVDEGLEVAELSGGSPLTPGRTLLVVPQAEDNRDLPETNGGNVAAGDAATLTVVTDSELLRLLEAREIMLREQFKALIDKVTRSRDGLVGLDENPVKPPAELSEEESTDGPPINRRSVLVEQTRTREKEQRAETLMVAEGFAAIVDELINNRAANSERLQERLNDEVARPLRHVGEKLFAEYEADLAALAAAVSRRDADPKQVAALNHDAIRSADAVLVEMNVVLDKMQKLESFKEAIDMLRTIIALQRDVGERTQKSRGDKSRLLGD